MTIVYEYSHLGGREILHVRFAALKAEIEQVVREVKVGPRSKVSRERTKKGRLLHSPIDLNAQFRAAFRARGFEELRDTYTIQLPGYPHTIKGAFKQIDYVKDLVLVEVQFGKYAFMFYDLAKFQYFFNEQRAEVGVEIVPCHAMHKQMSSGVSYGEQLIYDIERLRRHFPAVPVWAILIDV
jgi:hypothetical protein